MLPMYFNYFSAYNYLNENEGIYNLDYLCRVFITDLSDLGGKIPGNSR